MPRSAYESCHVCGTDGMCTAVSAELIAEATESGYIPLVPRTLGQRTGLIERASGLPEWLLCRKCMSALQPYLPERRETQGSDSRTNLEARRALMGFFWSLSQDAEPSPDYA